MLNADPRQPTRPGEAWLEQGLRLIVVVALAAGFAAHSNGSAPDRSTPACDDRTTACSRP